MTLLEVRNLTKSFRISATRALTAVDDVSFDIGARETLAVVGESGCGKSTTARLILGLLEATSGSVRLDGHELVGLPARRARAIRADMQAVFQDSTGSLDPRMTIGQSIAEPMQARRIGSRAEREARVFELLDRVGLPAAFAERYPHQISGGQRQRIGIARALAVRPRIVVLDEPVSALDLSVQAQVVTLLQDLQDEFALSYLFIAHDLGVVQQISNRVAVMYLGRIVESGPVDEVFAAPRHPYTQALLSAALDPDPDIERTRERIVLRGDPPSPMRIPGGCRFNPRCPRVREECALSSPPVEVRGARAFQCFFPVGEGATSSSR